MSTDAVLEQEERDGVRFTWNAWPSSSVEAKKHLIVPLGCMYTPLHRPSQGMPAVNYEPVACRGPCRSILNPFCNVDVKGKLWVCPFCFQRNAFPPQYAEISDTLLPAELQYTSIEYTLARPCAPPAFLLVVDTCLLEDDLRSLKETLIQLLGLLPQNSLVGLITFGTTVQVYELAFSECPKAYVFQGSRDITSQKVQELLGISPAQSGAASSGNSFLQPLSACELTLTATLEDLQRDPWPVKNDHRSLRATGVAMTVAMGLLEATCKSSAGRIMCFVGGPCTQGPGMVVGDTLSDTIRAHHDLIKDKAKYFTKAQRYYQGLSNKLVENGHTVDLFCCSLDQVGLTEMKDLCGKTGGTVVSANNFENEVFRNSLVKMFERDDKGALNMAFNATLEVQTSRELKVAGAMGNLASLNRRTPCVSEMEIGISGTSAWRSCGLDKQSSFGVFFEITAPPTSGAAAQGQKGVIQFLTHYMTSMEQQVLRVTTVSRQFVDTTTGLHLLSNNFDQETAAALMARNAVFKAETEDSYDVLRWLDRMLIKLVAKFADYRKDDPATFCLSPSFALYPQFMFHLRRSCFLQVFGNSPDETTFYRFILNRENVSNSLIMIQPTLESYQLNAEESIPSNLSAVSVVSDHILLLDTFFYILVWVGHKVAQLTQQGFAQRPEQEAFRRMLSMPAVDAANLMRDRVPHPRFIECVQYNGDERLLLSVVDPCVTSATKGGAEPVLTEDVNLQIFMEHLKKLAVQP
ncbi:copii coat protein [Pelomyxa schiedti]|nr:copii coat protein [Pelomyxa schiedti]